MKRAIKNNAHYLPFKEDNEGNPKPRKRVVTPPLFAHDPRAALDLAEVIVDGGDTEPYIKRLCILNSIAADENCDKAYVQLMGEHERLNPIYEKIVEALEVTLSPLKKRFNELSADAAALAAVLGLTIKEGWQLTFPDDAPRSKESIAGQKNIIYPEPPQPERDRKETLAVTIGGGAVLGILLGFLTDFIDTQSFSSEPLKTLAFAGIGMALVFAMGLMLKPLASLVGGFMYHAKVSSRSLRVAVVGTFGGLLVAGSAVTMLIESNVDRQGLIKAITETTTTRSHAGDPAGILWISLLVVVPIVGYYVARYLTNGYHRAAQARLVALQDDARAEVRGKEQYVALAKLCGELRPLEADITQLEKKRDKYEEGISYELTDKDAWQLDSLDNDGIEYSEKTWERVDPDEKSQKRKGTSKGSSTPEFSVWQRLRNAMGV
ncbi:MAG TPA: hypothetical protein VGL56_18375 [Fimbriimonadaceae bacterium]|jgi:hypothetical protein